MNKKVKIIKSYWRGLKYNKGDKKQVIIPSSMKETLNSGGWADKGDVFIEDYFSGLEKIPALVISVANCLKIKRF